MARCSFATWRPLPENSTQGFITPTQAIVHSAVDAPGPTSLWGFFARADVVVESHFFVKLDGEIEQYMDTERRADANRFVNDRAISIETEDEGNPDQRPWTAAQKAAIERLLDWIFKTHPGVLPRVCPQWDEPGVGYHSMWGAPSPWTPVPGKTCPGTIRIRQFIDWLVPWLHAWGQPVPIPETEDDMVLLIRTEGRPARAVVGSKIIGFKGGTEYNNFVKAVRDAGVPLVVWDVGPEQYEETSDVFKYSQAQVVA